MFSFTAILYRRATRHLDAQWQLRAGLRRFSIITLVSPARAERTCESIRLSVRFGARGHGMEVETFSTSMACPRAPKRTESLMHAFSSACSYKFAPPARVKLV